jgi:GTP-binding protein
MKFIDEVKIKLISGKGGPGHVSFRREAMVPRGGPDGGDGGDGGDVIFQVESRLHSLLDLRFQKVYKADDGEQGGTQNCAGKDGKDLVLMVPPGTLVKDDNGHILHDLGEGERIVFLEGGLGGKGNSFYKSSVNQAPTVAQKGLPGQEMEVHLELKLLADVGIMGLLCLVSLSQLR